MLICDNCENTLDPDWSARCVYCGRCYCPNCEHDTTAEEDEYHEWWVEERNRAAPPPDLP